MSSPDFGVEILVQELLCSNCDLTTVLQLSLSSSRAFECFMEFAKDHIAPDDMFMICSAIGDEAVPILDAIYDLYMSLSYIEITGSLERMIQQHWSPLLAAFFLHAHNTWKREWDILPWLCELLCGTRTLRKALPNTDQALRNTSMADLWSETLRRFVPIAMKMSMVNASNVSIHLAATLPQMPDDEFRYLKLDLVLACIKQHCTLSTEFDWIVASPRTVESHTVSMLEGVPSISVENSWSGSMWRKPASIDPVFPAQFSFVCNQVFTAHQYQQCILSRVRRAIALYAFQGDGHAIRLTFAMYPCAARMAVACLVPQGTGSTTTWVYSFAELNALDCACSCGNYNVASLLVGAATPRVVIETMRTRIEQADRRSIAWLLTLDRRYITFAAIDVITVLSISGSACNFTASLYRPVIEEISKQLGPQWQDAIQEEVRHSTVKRHRHVIPTDVEDDRTDESESYSSYSSDDDSETQSEAKDSQDSSQSDSSSESE